MTGKSIDYDDLLSRWKCNKAQAANDLERLLLREELPSPGSVARAIVTLREKDTDLSSSVLKLLHDMSRHSGYKLIESDIPGKIYMECGGLRYIFTDGVYQGFYNPDGPEDVQ